MVFVVLVAVSMVNSDQCQEWPSKAIVVLVAQVQDLVDNWSENLWPGIDVPIDCSHSDYCVVDRLTG